ncbi:hypothetical protein BATDEDRAFT_35849 [Batrachochytrium dendrobatidis JAM81]|uniref:Uncharacterized protein n=1 Tax=Batrachochytrium dendrobatidis (strain JAM81 / FGSC 10211) TaxID=684364 RepID=F4PA76_BATDJ|nr:uncharacterized protein BATDEDRAFT_35849 [Batrachochytrium dendrobatidis JAM81]EGF77854.1 hypothetical protein BATDEDRAFT_35849 [Batrachochytrium dendrobatidis JAM81]|eukprot:XP_006681452.1 hypothetical protein BATDEDRAFT_35849 [Batrachochytrium dendrobatidis JAM81]
MAMIKHTTCKVLKTSPFFIVSHTDLVGCSTRSTQTCLWRQLDQYQTKCMSIGRCYSSGVAESNAVSSKKSRFEKADQSRPSAQDSSNSTKTLLQLLEEAKQRLDQRVSIDIHRPVMPADTSSLNDHLDHGELDIESQRLEFGRYRKAIEQWERYRLYARFQQMNASDGSNMVSTLSAHDARMLASAIFKQVLMLNNHDQLSTTDDPVSILSSILSPNQHKTLQSHHELPVDTLIHCIETIIMLESHATYIGKDYLETNSSQFHLSDKIHALPIVSDHQRVVELLISFIRSSSPSTTPSHHIWRLKAYLNMLSACSKAHYKMTFIEAAEYFKWASKSLGSSMNEVVDLLGTSFVRPFYSTYAMQFIKHVLQALTLKSNMTRHGQHHTSSSTQSFIFPSTIARAIEVSAEEILEARCTSISLRDFRPNLLSYQEMVMFYDDICTLQGTENIGPLINVLIPVAKAVNRQRDAVRFYRVFRNLPEYSSPNHRHNHLQDSNARNNQKVVLLKPPNTSFPNSLSTPSIHENISLKTLDNVVQCCAESTNVSMCKIALRDLRACGGIPSVCTLFQIISMYWRLRDCDPSVTALTHVHSLYCGFTAFSPSFKLSSVCLAMVIEIYARYPTFRPESVQVIEDLVDAGIKRGIPMLKKLCEAMVLFYLRVEDLSQAATWFHRVPSEKAMQSDHYSLNFSSSLALDFARLQLKQGRIQDAKTTLDLVYTQCGTSTDYLTIQMQVMDALACITPVSKLNTSFEQPKPEQTVLDIFQQLLRQSSKPNAVSLQVVCRHLIHANRPNKALELIEQMQLEYRIPMTLELLVTAIDCHALSGTTPDKVMAIMEKMPKKEYERAALAAVACAVVRRYGRNVDLLMQIVRLEGGWSDNSVLLRESDGVVVMGKGDQFKARLGYY